MCGVPSWLAVTTPSTSAPQRKNFPINRSTLLSRMAEPIRPITMGFQVFLKLVYPIFFKASRLLNTLNSLSCSWT
jgi:hypothetical protein